MFEYLNGIPDATEPRPVVTAPTSVSAAIHVPSVATLFFLVLLLGPLFGLIPTNSDTQKAKKLGISTQSYWVAYVIGGFISFTIAYFVLTTYLAAGLI